MKNYVIEIVGIINIEAENSEDAKTQVRQMFYDGKISIDDLSIGIDYENSDTD